MHTRTIGNDTVGRIEVGAIGRGLMTFDQTGTQRREPLLETVLLDRRDLPSAGAGETPMACVAPAIRNAFAARGGGRLRSLPLA